MSVSVSAASSVAAGSDGAEFPLPGSSGISPLPPNKAPPTTAAPVAILGAFFLTLSASVPVVFFVTFGGFVVVLGPPPP